MCSLLNRERQNKKNIRNNYLVASNIEDGNFVFPSNFIDRLGLLVNRNLVVNRK